MIERQTYKLGIRISSFFSDTLRLSKKLALYILLTIYLIGVRLYYFSFLTSYYLTFEDRLFTV